MAMWLSVILSVGVAGAVAGSVRARRASALAIAPSTSRTLQLGLLAMGVFLMVFQNFTIGPMLPILAADFRVPTKVAGFLVPAYGLPYALAALVYGPLSDRIDRCRLITVSLSALTVALAGTGMASTFGSLMALRAAAGLAVGGGIAVSLARVADLYAYGERGQAIGAIFAAIGAGLAAGFSLGPILAAWMGWRAVFLGLAAVAAAVTLLFLVVEVPGIARNPSPGTYGMLLANGKARRAYALTIIVGTCTYGGASWFGVYAHKQFGLSGFGIGLAYLAYGAVCSLGPLSGALADRMGRARLLPLGFGFVSAGWALAAMRGPIPQALLGLALVALGHQLTYPLLVAIVSEVVPNARGRALGLNSFFLFLGISAGSLLIGAMLSRGFGVAFGGIALVAGVAAAAALLLRGEQ